MRRTLDNVPDEVDLETDGEVWATFPLTPLKGLILAEAVRTHQSIDTTIGRVVLRILREAYARVESS